MATGHLKIFFGEEQEDKVFVLESGKSYHVGRSAEAEIRLKDIKVSRQHCRVRTDGDRYYLQDLGSRNGTFVNGEKVQGEIELKDGDQIRLGFSVLQFFFADHGSQAVEAPAQAKKCALCEKEIDEADMKAGRAEEVDGKRYCPECMSKMQDLFEEEGKVPDLDLPAPEQPAPQAEVPQPAPSAEPELPVPPPEEGGSGLDLAGLIDDHGEEDLDLLSERGEERKPE